jgi:hypothetical protein
MNGWQRVYFSDKLYRAELVSAVLEEHNFNPVIVNRKDSAYQWGHYEVYVAPEFVLMALKIISDEISWS